MVNKIEKENIVSLKLVPAETDYSKKWKAELDYAVRLGNEHKGKTTITFQAENGLYQVETTVWSATDKLLSLKGGITIPLNSITEIHF